MTGWSSFSDCTCKFGILGVNSSPFLTSDLVGSWTSGRPGGVSCCSVSMSSLRGASSRWDAISGPVDVALSPSAGSSAAATREEEMLRLVVGCAADFLAAAEGRAGRGGTGGKCADASAEERRVMSVALKG